MIPSAAEVIIRVSKLGNIAEESMGQYVPVVCKTEEKRRTNVGE
jgi:hypothetical protein